MTARCLLSAIILFGLCQNAFAKKPPRRAKPPEWPQEVLDVFLENAHEHLVGERPTGNAAAVAQKSPKTKAVDPSFRWSEIIAADTLTSEVRRLNISLTTNLSKPGKFKGGGNLVCRRDFAMLAVLFSRIAEYDDEVRWQSIAPALASECLSASDACEKGTDESFALANSVKEYLDQLIQGQQPELAPTPGSESATADFALLMQRMEYSANESISPRLASKREFRRSKQQLAHESQLLALLALVIEHEDYGYGDDEEYLEFSKMLRESAQLLRRASDEGDYERAREASGNVNQSCSQCHEAFRG